MILTTLVSTFYAKKILVKIAEVLAALSTEAIHPQVAFLEYRCETHCPMGFCPNSSIFSCQGLKPRDLFLPESVGKTKNGL